MTDRTDTTASPLAPDGSDSGGSPTDVTLVSCMADEAPYLLEWIAWHVLIGAGRFVVYSTGCTDGTDTMLDRLADLGPLEHYRLDEPSDDKPPLRAALEAAAELPSVTRASWVLPLLPDEFVDITCGDGTFADLLEVCDAERLDAIAIPWRIMGSNGQIGFDPAPASERFCRGSRIADPEAPGLTEYRSLTRPASFSRLGPCRPWGWPTGETRGRGKRQAWCNGSGEDATEAFVEQKWRDQDVHPPSALGFDLVSLRRFAVKSRAEFLHRQLREGIPAESGRAPEGWDAWLLRDINTVGLPPLGPAVLREAVAELEGDPLLDDLQARARDRISREVRDLTDSQQAAALFLDTGDTRDPPAPGVITAASEGAPAPRFLCVATHPRAGTVWFRRTLREAAKAMEIPMLEVKSLFDLNSLPSQGPAILVNWHGTFPKPLFAMNEARLVHLVRDPRDVLISAAQFNPFAPQKGFGALHTPRPELDGMTYQQFAKALPDDVTRLAFELDHRHADVVEEMTAWATGHANTLELRYEELIADVECARFGAALSWAGIEGIDTNTVIAAYWKHAIFGGLAQTPKVPESLRRHIRSAQPERWRTEMPREIARTYAERHGRLLRLLGYAKDDVWVEGCPTATELAAAGAARSALQVG